MVVAIEADPFFVEQLKDKEVHLGVFVQMMMYFLCTWTNVNTNR